ncbi:hypothetical protein BMT54_08940 [Pasteurellaceae bacterium 15-036681]|nr:hypothetical protein BMT54_08940 [Pasteurellaceae bacterium 15-036681]
MDNSENRQYDLSHLAPIDISFFGEKVNKELLVRILFSDHCFTERSDEYSRNSARKFSRERYELSKHLPEIIRSMFNEKVNVYQTSARRNFAYVVKVSL